MSLRLWRGLHLYSFGTHTCTLVTFRCVVFGGGKYWKSGCVQRLNNEQYRQPWLLLTLSFHWSVRDQIATMHSIRAGLHCCFTLLSINRPEFSRQIFLLPHRTPLCLPHCVHQSQSCRSPFQLPSILLTTPHFLINRLIFSHSTCVYHLGHHVRKSRWISSPYMLSFSCLSQLSLHELDRGAHASFL